MIYHLHPLPRNLGVWLPSRQVSALILGAIDSSRPPLSGFIIRSKKDVLLLYQILHQSKIPGYFTQCRTRGSHPFFPTAPAPTLPGVLPVPAPHVSSLLLCAIDSSRHTLSGSIIRSKNIFTFKLSNIASKQNTWVIPGYASSHSKHPSTPSQKFPGVLLVPSWHVSTLLLCAIDSSRCTLPGYIIRSQKYLL